MTDTYMYIETYNRQTNRERQTPCWNRQDNFLKRAALFCILLWLSQISLRMKATHFV